MPAVSGSSHLLEKAVLWAEGAAVVCHATALAAHDLSDMLPVQTNLTVTAAWARRRLRVPPGVVLHFVHVPAADRGWFGAVQITWPARTLNDRARASLSPDLLAQALRQALARGRVSELELVGVRACFGATEAPSLMLGEMGALTVPTVYWPSQLPVDAQKQAP